MEQIVKQIFSSGQKDQLDNVKQNCLAAKIGRASCRERV